MQKAVLEKEKQMKALRISGITAMVVLCVGMAIGQDASHDVDKTATKTGHFVKHAGKKVGHATKTGVKDTGHGTKVVAKDSAKGVKKTGEGIKDAASK
jgi:cell division protein FtsL